MSAQGAEALRQGLELWVQQDYDAAVFLTDGFDRELEWDISGYPLPDWPDTGRGREDFARHLSDYVRGWIGYRAEVREVIDVGEEIVVVVHETARLRDSDAQLDRDLHIVWTVRDEVVTRVRVFRTREDALDAAGLNS